jgi:hypothetical protein
MSVTTPQNVSTIRRAGDWLAWLGGGDDELLLQVPRARARFVQMGLVLMTTASLAVLSMSFALHDGMHITWLAAVPFGLLWGFVILNLDRFLVLSMGTTRDLKHLFAMASPRLVMAALLALVISTPLVLRVFASTIDNEMRIYQRTQSQQQGQQEATTADQLRADRLKAQIDAQQHVLDGHLPDQITDPAAQHAQHEVDDLETKVGPARDAKNTAYEAWQCELYGAGARCHNASSRRGPGPLAAAKKREYDDALRSYTSLQGQLTAAQRVLDTAEKQLTGTEQSRLAKAQAAARAQLPGLEQQYATLTEQIGARSDDDTRANHRDTGILAQMRALSQATAKSSALRTAHLVLAGLFFMIELLPVLVKVLMNLAPASAYDVLAELKDEELKDRAKIQRVEARQVEEDKSETRIKAEQDMRRHELDLSKEANQRVADEMATIVEAALVDWSKQVHAQLGGQPAPGATNGASAAASGATTNPPPSGPANGGGASAGGANISGASAGGANGAGAGQRRPGRSSVWPANPSSASAFDDADEETEATAEVSGGYEMSDGDEL